MSRRLITMLLVTFVLSLCSAPQSVFSKQETVSIPYEVSEARPGATRGADCSFFLAPIAPDSPIHQIEVKNAEGVLVGLASLRNGEVILVGPSSAPTCKELGVIEVPQSNFYTIYFDGVRYRSVSADELPLGLADIL